MVSIIKKHLTTNAIIIQSDDGVYAQQVNYGTSSSTPSDRSVTDVIVRHFEDYASKFIVDKIYTGFICSLAGGQDISVSQGTANVKGIEVSSDGIFTITIPTVDDTYYIILQKGDDGGSAETRIPLNDTISLTYVIDGSFDEDTDYILAKVDVVSSTLVAGSFEDFGAFYELRQDHIKPRNGSTIKLFTGSYPVSNTFNTFFSGVSIYNPQDGAQHTGGYFTGYNNDLHVYHLSGTGNIIDNKNSQDMWVRLDNVSKFGFRSTGFEIVDNLIVSGTSSLVGNVGIGGTLTVSGTLQVIGDITMDSDELILNDNAYIGIDSDTDLLQLKDQVLAISGSILMRDTIAYIGTEADPNLVTLQDGNLLLSGSLELEANSIIGTDVNLTNAKLEILDDIGSLTITNGNFIVGDGTNWVAESGQTALNSLGFGDIDNTPAINQDLLTETSNVEFNSIWSGTMWSGASIANAYIDNDITLTNITQITNRSHVNLSAIGSLSHANIDTHIAGNTASGVVHTSNIAGNTASGVTNASNIATNVTAIGLNTTHRGVSGEGTIHHTKYTDASVISAVEGSSLIRNVYPMAGLVKQKDIDDHGDLSFQVNTGGIKVGGSTGFGFQIYFPLQHGQRYVAIKARETSGSKTINVYLRKHNGSTSFTTIDDLTISSTAIHVLDIGSEINLDNPSSASVVGYWLEFSPSGSNTGDIHLDCLIIY